MPPSTAVARPDLLMSKVKVNLEIKYEPEKNDDDDEIENGGGRNHKRNDITDACSTPDCYPLQCIVDNMPQMLSQTCAR